MADGLVAWALRNCFLVLVDTVRSDGPAGTIRLYRRDELLKHAPEARLSPHDPGVKEALLTAEFAGVGPREVLLVGAVPMDSAMGVRLSPPLRAAVPRAVAEVLRAYGRSLQWVLRRQRATLVVTGGTLALTLLLFLLIPKGFFPLQDTGVILGITEGPQAVSFGTMGERQQALERVILEEPAVESLSSFIGVDGTNSTLNSGRMYINLKPLGERMAGAGEIIRRIEARMAEVDGITLHMQPVQDLTVEDRVSRTQFQYTLEDADPEDLNRWAPKLLESLQVRPELRDVSSDQLNQGLASLVEIDRNTASRMGITPQLITDTLYDAFGNGRSPPCSRN